MPTGIARRRRVAITGAGAVTALGRTLEETWVALLAGHSGFRAPTLFDAERWGARWAAEIADVPADPAGETTERAARLALAAADEAVSSSGLPVAGDDTALVVGTTLGGTRDFTAWLDAGAAGEAPESGGTSAATRLLARRLGIRGPVMTLSAACASGTAAIGAAAELVAGGACERAVAGGFDAISAFVFSGFASLRALSPGRVRPFDRRRDGLGLGEGASFLVLEPLDAARARGARVFALVEGYGSASDAFHMTRPDPLGGGLLRATAAALEDAGRAADEIGFVSAHGTGTVFNDAMESVAFRQLLGARTPAVPVHALKGAVGHLLGAAGALEAAITALVLERRLVPPTAGLEELDPACGLDLVRGAARELPDTVRVALSTSSAFGGGNAALVLGSP